MSSECLLAAAPVACASRTHPGCRAANEDSFLMLAERGVFIVADGMGGHAAGEVASGMAVRLMSRSLSEPGPQSDAEAADRMRAAVRTANAAIFARTLRKPDERKMGTTATALVLRARRYMIGHVGDSRAYLFRSGRLLQITRDHTCVQELVDDGLLTRAQARVHPYRNVITRHLGSCGEVVPDIHVGTSLPGDFLLVASDGLTGMLEDEDLIRILSSRGGPEDWVDRMIAEANARGGPDNITAIAVRV